MDNQQETVPFQDRWPVLAPPSDSGSGSAELRALQRHADRQARGGEKRGGPRTYGVAFDVWRDGALLWRSYPQRAGEWPSDYATRVFGPDSPQNHDAGVWAVRGAVTADWLVPGPAAFRQVLGLSAVCDLAFVVTAMALGWEAPSAKVSLVPSAAAISGRLLADGGGFTVLRWEVPGSGVFVRMAVAGLKPADSAAVDDGAQKETALWRAALVDRSSGEILRQAEVRVAQDAPTPAALIRRVSRAGKAALGLTGWPATRHYPAEGLVWRLVDKKLDIHLSPFGGNSPA